MLDLVGIEHPASNGPNALDGLSLVPLLLRGEALAARILFWRTPSQKAVRQGPWKLVGDELYNLADDLAESRDLAASRPEMVRLLKAKLEAWEKEMRNLE